MTHVEYTRNSTLRREEPEETLKDQNHKKKIWDVGRRSVSKRIQKKHSEWKQPYETLNRAKPLSNNNSWAEEEGAGGGGGGKEKKERKKKPFNEPVKSERSPMKTTEKNIRMVNHHGPLPLKELHSTGETIVWRDPGGS